MYTLRRISSDGVEMNHYLGKGYTVIDRTKAPEKFQEDHKVFFKGNCSSDDKDPAYLTYAFVGNEDGSFVQPLYKNQKNYIVTESGKTISNLSDKDGVWREALQELNVKGVAVLK